MYKIQMKTETFNDVLFKLAELLENKIGCEMEGTKGALVYDSWSIARMHYLGVFSSY